ncbi:MAG: type II secretion system protein GspD [Alphaproteobacteria bacterium]|nr:MAG: type II secretion system protein GspD [Alphaproteobacteria bacterium]
MRWPQRRFRSVSGGRLIPLFCLVALVTAACNVLYNEDQRREPDVFDKVRSIDLLPRFPQPAGTVSTGRAGGVPSSTYLGEASAGTDLSRVIGAQPAASGDGYELNFENTPVTGVAKVVLGDILGIGYIIDPRVQGTVTLASGRPVPKGDLLFVLESALRLSGAALVRDKRGYVILPAAEAVGSGGVDAAARGEPGYGVTVIPLQYVSATTLGKLLDSFATKAGSVRVEPSRNLVLIQGSGPDRRNAAETVLSFDADWMRGQSVGIYPVRNSTPEPVMSELERIMDLGEGGMSQALIKLQPIARLNAIMVISSKPALLKTAATWIARLDKSDTASTGVKVYQVRYGDARQMAQLLTDIFGSGRSGGAIDSATNQIAPGAGLLTSTSDVAQQGGLRIGGARVQPGGSSADSRLSGATTSPAIPAQAGGANDIVASRSGPFGRAGVTPGAGAGLGGGAFGGGGQAGQGSILPGVRITADAVNNTLLIYANQESYRVIEQTLKQLDRPQLQVSIDATIAEITLNENLNYGVQAFLSSQDVGAHPDKGSGLITAGTTAILARTLPGFNFLLGPESQPNLILNALRAVSDVKVLSTPSVVVLDNQVATLQVGDQVPVATASATVLSGTGAPVVNTIDYRNTGVILRVVPRINANGNVLLDVEQEISNVAAGSAGSLTPTVSQRRVKSSIAVASGQTVLLAGLISERSDKQRTGLPIIDQLPLGDLLGNTNKTKQRTELIIFIRPQIIRDGVDAMRVAEEMRTKLQGRLGTTDPRYMRK